MQTQSLRRLNPWSALAALAVSAGCNSVTGLDDFSVGTSSAVGECTTNSECIERASSAGDVPAVCVQPEGRCVKLMSEDCATVTGELNDDSIVIASLFATTGSQAQTNMQRQQSAMLAVQQINSVGGVPAPASGGNPRNLVLLSCDANGHLARAAEHLVTELQVPAMVGPNNSQDVLDVSNQFSIRGGTVVMSPTGIASSIADLIDDDLTWLMVPSDTQRAPLMISQLNDIESQLKSERGLKTVKLAVIFRNDALGIGTRTSLNDLVINGKAISDPINLGRNVLIEPYVASDADQTAIVQATVALAPDIIVLAGTAEAITNVMKPVEMTWPAATPRPYYMMIDPTKVPELLQITTGNDDLRHRIRGTGVTPAPDSVAVYNSFKVDYQVAFPGSSATISGMGPTYDATYAIAFALAATRDRPPSGPTIASGLRRLAGGPTEIEVGGTSALRAFQRLAAGEKISAHGTFCPFDWNENGAVLGGTLEMWCVGANAGTTTYQSSGLTYDLGTQQPSGQYTQCGP